MTGRSGSDGIELPEPSGNLGGYVSDLLVDALRALGCSYVALNPGSSFRGLHDSLVNHGGNRDPQLLLCTHEEIAVALAHGYAKATGEVAVAAVHDLVGLMHASMAVYDAWADQTPVLLLGGGGPADPAARRPIDWLHSAAVQAQLVRGFVKWDDEPAGAQATVDAVVRAHQVAGTAPTGPVYVTLDAGLQETPVSGGVALPELARHRPAPGPGAAAEAVDAAAHALVGARWPLLVAGRVCYQPAVTPLLVELSEALAAAYVDERHGVSFPTAHPHNLSGQAGLAAEADVLLAVDVRDLQPLLGTSSTRDRAGEGGTRTSCTVLDLSLRPMTTSSWSHAQQAPAPVDIALCAEPLEGLRQLLGRVRELLAAAGGQAGARAGRAAQLSQRHDALRVRQMETVRAEWDQRPVAPSRLVSELWRLVEDKPWVLALRNTRSWPEAVWQFDGAGQYMGHSGGAGVGYGPGAMVGVALAARDRGQLPLAVIGDGDFLMGGPGALWTAVHYRIPLLAIVNNNQSFYNDEEHQTQVARTRGRPEANSWIGMRMEDPAVDLAALARAYGADAHGPVTDPDDLPGVLAEALAAVEGGRVVVVDVHTAR